MKKFRVYMVASFQTKWGSSSASIGYTDIDGDNVNLATQAALTYAANHGWPDADVSGVEVLEGGLGQDA